MAEPTELESQAIAALVRLGKLLGGESDVCPHCNQSAAPLRQVGHSIYGECGCRICQGVLQRGKKP